MKRVTFRVPEDHEIVVSAEIVRMAIVAEHQGARAATEVYRCGEGTYTCNHDREERGALDEAQAAAVAYVRAEVRRVAIAHKIADFA